jgi:hypothetical protein
MYNVLYHLRSLALFQRANAELAALSPSDGRRQDDIVAAGFNALSTLSQLDSVNCLKVLCVSIRIAKWRQGCRAAGT